MKRHIDPNLCGPPDLRRPWQRAGKHPGADCVHCGTRVFNSMRNRERLCVNCAGPHMNLGHAAHSEVAKAIRCGVLPHPSLLVCVDCGRQAQEYDHRDYSRPLMVEPVCRSCNSFRGICPPPQALAA